MSKSVRAVAVLLLIAIGAAGCSSSDPASPAVAFGEAPVPAASPSPVAVAARPEPPATTSPARPSPTPLPTPQAATPTPAPPAPAPLSPPAPLEWRTCGGLECATLTVPVDYTEPDGGTIELAVARRAATGPGERIGSLVLNPGGPGASGIDFLESFAFSTTPELGAQFDLVSWDPRGVGASSGLDCGTDVASSLNAVVSVDDGLTDDLERSVVTVTELGAACVASAPALLDHIGTVATAHDLDRIRQAVGDTGLTYLGFSYGTRLGTVYATLFPDKVRGMALDGAFPPGLPSLELARNAGDLEATLGRIDAVCALEQSCRVREPGLLITVEALLAELDTTADADGLGLSDRTMLLGATLLAVYVPDVWAVYSDAVADAAGGDLTLLERLARAWFTDQETGDFNDIYAGANTAIMCADRGYPTGRAAALRDAAAASVAVDVLADVTIGATCEGWPVAGEPLPPIDTSDAPPLLVVGGTHDPATPLRWAELLVDQLETAELLTYVGDGHTIVGQGNGCVDAVAVAYLTDLILPAPGTVCRAPTGVLGVRIALVDDGIQIESVVVGGAADRAGIAPGDVVVAIDDEPALALEQMTTSAGQILALTVRRGNAIQPIEVVAEREPWTLGE